MLIILEGPDGAGKTTLANQLQTVLENRSDCTIHRFHCGPPDSHPLDEYLRPLNLYRPGTGDHVIIDRWHWGESVYPRLLNRPTKLDTPARWAIEAYLRRLGAVMVLVDQFSADFIATYAQRGEFDLIRQLADTKIEFASVSAQSQLPFMMYNWRKPGCSPHEIVNVARNHEKMYEPLSKFTTYCGARWPHWLLLGDVRHKLVESARPNDPAFVPFPATSGHFLLGALDNSPQRQPGDIAWANACDVDDPAELWKTLGQPNVAALGRNAQRRLSDLGIPHGVAPHPQFARRFHHGWQREYGDAVLHAVINGMDVSTWPKSSSVKPAKTPTTTS